MTFHCPNYRRKALEYMQELAPRQTDPALSRLCDLHVSTLADPTARSFLLPTNGEIIRYDTAAKLTFEDVHLPFSRCILEYQISPDWYVRGQPDSWKPSATILMLSQEEQQILMSVMWQGEVNGHVAWIPSGIAIGISSRSTLEVMSTGVRGGIRLENFQPYIAHRKFGGLADQPGAVQDFIDECRVFGHFVLLCSCDNISPERIYSPSSALQKKAARNGRPALHDYYVLDISLPSGKEHGDGTGAHGGVRFHVRRGHVRRLPSGRRTWVRQCTVGDPTLGVVTKDYRVRSL